MHDDLKAKFKALGSFPSPPGIAQQIIELAKNPDATIGEVTAAIAKDPALATKVLRMANSAVYAQRRRSQNLRQALTVLGLDASMTLCLGFSIAGSFRSGKAGSIDYPRYWRRSLLAALGSRCVGESLGCTDGEELFLGGLLQDVGVLALDRAKPGFYGELPAEHTHAARCAYERERLGEDHAALGAWLLESWNLPGDLVNAVALSHQPEQAGPAGERAHFAQAVALGGELATALLATDRTAALNELSQRARRFAGLTQEQLAAVIQRVTELAPDYGHLFETTLLSPEDALLLTEQAQELLAVRSVESLHAIDTLRHTTSALAARSEEAEENSRRDGLTGLYNRRHLDAVLAAEFTAAVAGGWSLGVLFIDLDHFKRINDTYGHAGGDEVLRGTAGVLKRALRETDVAARFGGEEFVVLLPGTSPVDARRLAERLLATLRATTHNLNNGAVTVTASLGFAVHAPSRPFAGAAALLAAADEAVYAAKRGGRDRIAGHGIGAPMAAAG